MLVQGVSPRRTLRPAYGVLVCAFAGCGTEISPIGGSGSRPQLDANTSSTYYESSSNDLLDLAEPIAWNNDIEVISGKISSSDDVDVYDLGPGGAGDHVVVTMAPDAELNAAVALFDGSGDTLLVNDHRNVYLGRQGPFIDVVIRRPSEACYVAVATTPGFSGVGEYLLGTSIDVQTPLPDPRPDVVVLDFDAERGVRVGSRPVIDVPDFDAVDISADYSGMTDEIVRLVVEMVREDFEGLDVTILSTSEGVRPEKTMSRVHFGVFDAALLGVAEGVDEYNAASGQAAIVFTDTFEAFMQLHPSAEEIAKAIANVASHEIGHLLGLVHTEDPDDLMDVTASLRELMVDQDFRRAPIYEAVFPIGDQDSLQMLLDSVGGDASVARGMRESRDRMKVRVEDGGGSPARKATMLGGCGLPEVGRSGSSPTSR
ncbi:MAG: matrixin family metalloprotease [Planctomycetota bacterium]